MSFADGARIADEIRCRIREELGITVSVGVADNKILAKLGSDMKKPDAVTVLPPDSFQEKIRDLPVQDLLFVGPRTAHKLAQLGVTTIGQLAACDDGVLQGLLGKNGPMLKAFASGQDRSPVMPLDHRRCVKSIGNSTTPPQIVDKNVQPILDRSEVYSGCYARVSLNFYAFNSNGNKGVACGLGNIQKIRDGESLGGRSSAADDFTTVDDDDFLS